MPPAQAFEVLIRRIDERKDVLTGIDGSAAYRLAVVELENLRMQLVKAQQYFVATYTESTVKSRR
jgi:hypothetical protein